MAIRLDGEVAAQPSLFSASPEPVQEAGADPLLTQQADPQSEPYGLSIYHDGSDKNKGAGIRI